LKEAPKAEVKKEAPTPEEEDEKEEVKIDAAKEAPNRLSDHHVSAEEEAAQQGRRGRQA
jgi:hypothetical protein